MVTSIARGLLGLGAQVEDLLTVEEEDFPRPSAARLLFLLTVQNTESTQLFRVLVDRLEKAVRLRVRERLRNVDVRDSRLTLDLAHGDASEDGGLVRAAHSPPAAFSTDAA